MIVQVGPYPEPIGGISIYIKRMKEYLDLQGIKNEVWDVSGTKKNLKEIISIRLRYVPLRYLFNSDIKIIHYNLCGIAPRIYIGIFNKLFFKSRKKIITIHGESKNLFIRNNNKLLSMSLNTFNVIICVKRGDKEYLRNRGISTNIYEIPAFIYPGERDEDTKINNNIIDFMESKNFVITANASSIQFYDDEDLYGIDMCVELMIKLKIKFLDMKIGFIFCLPDVNDEQYYNKMLEVIKNNNIDKNFLFITEKVELYPIIKRSNLFIRPTNVDGYGVSIAEAIYFKIPAIASDVCVRSEGTVLFESRNIEDLYDKVKIVMENYDIYKEKIKNIVLENSAEIIMDIYKKLLIN